MAAPDSAYQTEKYRMRQGTAETFHRIAKYTGRHNSIANAKSVFHLDYVFAIRKSGSDYGFVGMVAEGGTNAGWRSSARLSQKRIRRGSTNYRLLLDGGLNIQGHAGSPTIRYAFCNYFSITWPIYGAPYEGCTYALKMSQTSGGTPQFSSSGSVGQDASTTGRMESRGGIAYWDSARTIYLRAEVTNADGTRTATSSVAMLPPLNPLPFAPASSYGETALRNDPDMVTIAVDAAFEDYIYNLVDGYSAPSVPQAPAAGYNVNALYLGEGELGSSISDANLVNYYNSVKNGGSSWAKPANGYYINVTGRRIGTQQVYYGIYVSGGKITQVFRARTPQTQLPRITLVISITSMGAGTNKYNINFSLTATETPASRVTCTITELQLRKTQTGAVESGQFTNFNGSVFNGRTLSIGGSGTGMVAAGATLTTSLATPFWVTATASIDSGSYEFYNPGGNSSGGGSEVIP